MRITKNGNVLVEITNRVHGMLEQGGYCGRILAYNANKLAALIGCSLEELEKLDWDDSVEVNNGYATVSYIAEVQLKPRVIRKGEIIQ